MAFTKVRTRFAPSPTGYMHVGNLRTALYAYLLAKSTDGEFILRIEDTDQERYIEGAVEIIYKTLKEAGIHHDEGPDIGGDFGPYIQSQRRELYKKYVDELIDMGKAYYCFCDKERLQKLKEENKNSKAQNMYDGHCLKLTKEEISEKIKSGQPYVIRQKIKKTGTTTFRDTLYGEIKVENSTLDDSVLIKSDGLPTYNFANVIDDHLMNISHIIRGSEYLSSTPKYNLLYEAFGWEIPTYIHVSPVMKDANKKLSKREGDASYEDFIKKGYLPEAIVNYIVLLGWSPGADREIFSLDELIENFNIKGLSKSPSIFDEQKLSWMNGEYLRKMSEEEFYTHALPYINQTIKNPAIDLKEVSTLLQTRVEKLTEIPETIDFFDELPEYNMSLYTHKRMKTNPENSIGFLEETMPVLENIDQWEEKIIHDKLIQLVNEKGLKNGQIMWPLRVALSGKASTPGGAIELAYILGKDEAIKRTKKGIQLLRENI